MIHVKHLCPPRHAAGPVPGLTPEQRWRDELARLEQLAAHIRRRGECAGSSQFPLIDEATRVREGRAPYETLAAAQVIYDGLRWLVFGNKRPFEDHELTEDETLDRIDQAVVYFQPVEGADARIAIPCFDLPLDEDDIPPTHDRGAVAASPLWLWSPMSWYAVSCLDHEDPLGWVDDMNRGWAMWFDGMIRDCGRWPVPSHRLELVHAVQSWESERVRTLLSGYAASSHPEPLHDPDPGPRAG